MKHQKLFFRTTGLAVIGFLLGCAGLPMTMNSFSATDGKGVQGAGLGFFETQSFDVVVDNNRLHVMASGLLAAADKQPVVRYVYSDDGGQHWSKPSDVLMPKAPSMNIRGNDLQLAVAGDKIMALWQTTGEIPGMGPMVSVHSTDGGATWQAGSNPAGNNAGDQSHLDMVAAGDGAIHAVWLDDRNENGYQGVRYARSDDAGVSWQKNITLDDSSCSCCWNKIAFAPSGALNVLYRDMEVRDMGLSQSLDKGVNWQKPLYVGEFGWKFEGCPHVGGGLAFSSNGWAHSVVWTGVEQKQGLYYLRSTDGGKQWSKPHKLGDRAMHGDIATVGEQRVRAVWDETGPEGSAVYSTHSNDGGLTWVDTIQWSVPSHNAVHPRIVPAQNGFLLLWTEKYAKHASQLVTVFVE